MQTHTCFVIFAALSPTPTTSSSSIIGSRGSQLWIGIRTTRKEKCKVQCELFRMILNILVLPLLFLLFRSNVLMKCPLPCCPLTFLCFQSDCKDWTLYDTSLLYHLHVFSFLELTFISLLLIFSLCIQCGNSFK